jgi:hypothetical protein
LLGENSFLSQFLTRQREKGRDFGPLFQQMTTEPTPAPVAVPAAPVITQRPQYSQLPPVVLAVRLDSLTACVERAEQPATARAIYRLLFQIGLQTVRMRGLEKIPDVAVFHLPLELLAAHLGVSRETLWRNLKPLKRAGILDARDHYSTLRGQNSVSGKLWAVSLRPERQFSGQAEPVRVTIDDLKFNWRDLDADAQAGRTIYAMTRTEERQALDAARNAEREPERAEARARAAARKSERLHATRAGKKPLRGRKAATINAAETRAARGATPPSPKTQQSEKRGLKLIDVQELMAWALAPFSTPAHDVTLTVAPGLSSGLDAIFTLPTLAGLSRRDRGAVVEKTARSLAASFEDTANLKFWCWLLWQLLRGADGGQNWADDVAHVLARVYHDLRHDESMNNRSAKKPGALVVAELRASGLLDALRGLAPLRVGSRPNTAA